MYESRGRDLAATTWIIKRIQHLQAALELDRCALELVGPGSSRIFTLERALVAFYV